MLVNSYKYHGLLLNSILFLHEHFSLLVTKVELALNTLNKHFSEKLPKISLNYLLLLTPTYQRFYLYTGWSMKNGWFKIKLYSIDFWFKSLYRSNEMMTIFTNTRLKLFSKMCLHSSQCFFIDLVYYCSFSFSSVDGFPSYTCALR